MSKISEFCIGFKHFMQDIKPCGIPRAHFLKSEWENFKDPGSVSWLYLTWRGMYALFCIFTVSFSISTSTHPHLWLTYLTRWSIVSQLIYSTLFLIDLICYKSCGAKRDKKIVVDAAVTNAEDDPETVELDPMLSNSKAAPEHPPLLTEEKNTAVETVIWIMVGIVGTAPIFVTLGYWTLVYPSEKDELTAVIFFGTVCVHGINALFSIVDTFLVAIPVRITQFVFLVTFGLLYAIFSGLYEIAGGSYATEPDQPYIYAVLNWREHPNRALITSAITVPVMIFLYLFLWLLYVLRLRLVYKCSCRKDREDCYYLHQYWKHFSTNNSEIV